MPVAKVYSLYNSFEKASSAYDALQKYGYDVRRISWLVNNENGHLDDYITQTLAGTRQPETLAGAGAVAGMVAGLTATVIPIAGPVVAAGTLAIALIAGIGASIGAIAGASIDTIIDFEPAATHHKVAQLLSNDGVILLAEEYGEWDKRHIESVISKFAPIEIGRSHAA